MANMKPAHLVWAGQEIIDMEEPLHLLAHVLEHSFADLVYVAPFLFFTYLALEWFEHKLSAKSERLVEQAGKAGPFVGAVLGVVPQCGFSVAAATLYSGRAITLGTLFAVFLSTSDEMLPIFIAAQVPFATMLEILLVKAAIGMAAGFAVDAVLRFASEGRQGDGARPLCRKARCRCVEDGAQQAASMPDSGCSAACGHSHASIVKAALVHTLQILAFILVVAVALNLAIELVGESVLSNALSANPMLSVVVSALIGFIPNCAASVVIAQLYAEGVLSAGAMLSGLLTSSGLGVLVLLRSNRGVRQNMAIVATLFAIGVLCGLCVDVLGVSFL